MLAEGARFELAVGFPTTVFKNRPVTLNPEKACVTQILTVFDHVRFANHPCAALGLPPSGTQESAWQTARSVRRVFESVPTSGSDARPLAEPGVSIGRSSPI
jgi:hypothetical protein